MKAELLAGNTICSSHFTMEESKDLWESCSLMLWEWDRSPFPHWAKERARETHPSKRYNQTTKHQICNLLRGCVFLEHSKNRLQAVLRHRFNFCSPAPRNAVPACRKKVNERFSRPHNHVSVTFGSCELMPEIFGGYPLWSSLIHNQCPINLQEPNDNDYWPFPTHTKTQWVTAMLLASGYSQICLHICTPSKISSANNRLSSAVWGIFYICSPKSRATASRFMNFLLQKNLELIQDAHLLTEKYFYCICLDSSLFRVSMEAKE